MAKLVVRDKKGELANVAESIINKYKPFRQLKEINVLFVWRLGDNPKYDDEGRIIAASTRKLPNRERDIYGFDIEIEVWKQAWRRRGKKAKRRLMWHELRHVELEEGENFKVNRDEDGRVIVNVISHDIVVTTFEDEVKKFGLASRDINDAVILSKALKRRLKDKK